jgi:hypothetical protein
MKRNVMIPVAGCVLLLGAALLIREGRTPSFTSMDEKESRSPSAIPSTDNRISLSENPQEVRPHSDKMPDAAQEPVETAKSSPKNSPRNAQGAVSHPLASSAPRVKRPMAKNVLPDDSDEVSANLEETDLAGVESEATQSYQLPAVRLAHDVPLPAVILTLNEEQIDPENKTPKPIKDAMKSIVDKFYTNLAESAAEGDYVSKDPDGTLVVGKGPGVERAREEADQIYRALFGEEAYNRMTMDSVLESQLPVVDSSAEEPATGPAAP